MTHHRLVGRSALQAFQADLPEGWGRPTRDDNAAVLAATMLRQSLAAEDEETASRVRAEALTIARESLGEDALATGCSYDDFPARSSADVFRLLAQRTDHSGRVHLAAHILESAVAIALDPIDAARTHWDHSRMLRKLGQIDLSYEQTLQLLREARRLKSPDLAARAHSAFVAIAQTRGNYVEMRTQTKRVIRIAKSARLNSLLASGYSGLATAD